MGCWGVFRAKAGGILGQDPCLSPRAEVKGQCLSRPVFVLLWASSLVESSLLPSVPAARQGSQQGR